MAHRKTDGTLFQKSPIQRHFKCHLSLSLLSPHTHNAPMNFHKNPNQRLLEVQLHTFKFYLVDVFIEPQEHLHIQLAITLVPVSNSRTDFRNLGLWPHRSRSYSTHVPPDAPILQFHSGRRECIRTDMARRNAVCSL